MLSDMLISRALFPDRGGSGGGIAVMTAKRDGEDWSSYPFIEAMGLYRLFDTVPTVEQLCKATLICGVDQSYSSDVFEIKQLYPQGDNPDDGVIEEDGYIYGGYRNDQLFMAFPTDEVAEMFGATKGIWFIDDTMAHLSFYKSVTLVYE